MTRLKKILLILLIVFVAMQFIRPDRNANEQTSNVDFIKYFSVPASVGAALRTSCYDCHSNNTCYPWYSDIEPIGWLLLKHVREGKTDLNFSDF
jgi:hypothetical protein